MQTPNMQHRVLTYLTTCGNEIQRTAEIATKSFTNWNYEGDYEKRNRTLHYYINKPRQYGHVYEETACPKLKLLSNTYTHSILRILKPKKPNNCES
jgi:hypothetical protein